MQKVSLDPQTLLVAYSQGAFPMADARGRVRWYTADPRGVLPLDGFHCPGTLRQAVRRRIYDVRINTAFADTMRACQSVPRAKLDGGAWISDELVAAYTALHELGFAHSVESYFDGELVGGLYGVAIGGAFFGESMFHRRSDASKVALVHLVDRLIARGFTLLDTQMVTSHMRQFGCIEIPGTQYDTLLAAALQVRATFDGQ